MVYGVVALLVMLIAADLLGWTATGSAGAAVWQLGLRLVSAGVALLIGWLGARWARTQIPADAETHSPTEQARIYTALAILGCATVLAITLLADNLQMLVGLLAVLLLAVVLWPLRGYIPDYWAGRLLRGQRVRQVRIEGAWFQLNEVGLLGSQLTRGDEKLTLRNRLVMDAYLQANGTDGAASRS